MSFSKLKFFFRSCHASLEHNLCEVLKEHQCHITTGNFARSHEERPGIPGYNDKDFGDIVRGHVDNMCCEESDFRDCNVIFTMNTSKFHQEIKMFSRFRPTILYLFGQWIEVQLDELAGVMNKQFEDKVTPNIFVICYSYYEWKYLTDRLALEIKENCFHIRFGFKLEEYRPWMTKTGNGLSHYEAPERLPFAYTTSNSIHKRGKDCGWPVLQQIREKIFYPHLLSGHETGEVKGMGRIDWREIRRLMWNCGAYVSFPAWPAPLVMNMMEAMISGCPVAFYDNGRGASQESIFNDDVGCLSNDPTVLADFVNRCLSDKGYRKVQSDRCLERGIHLFRFETAVSEWAKVLEKVSKLV